MKNILINFIEFFLVLSVMFVLFSFLSHIAMRKVSLDKIFSLMDNKIKGSGNFVSAFFGAVTPFCVCTTIPIFTSMIQMGVKTNVAVSFLFSSPLINISSAVLLFFLFGVKFSVYYIIAALVFSILGGLLVRWFNMDNEISPLMLDKAYVSGEDKPGVYKSAAKASFSLFRDLFLPLLFGAVSAGLIHNYVPVSVIESINRYPLWVLIPLVALIGFPIYSNIMVLAPICFALVNKGMNGGAVVTFMMSGAGISFPTAIVLKSLFKTRLFLFYLFYTFISYCLIGFIFNILN